MPAPRGPVLLARRHRIIEETPANPVTEAQDKLDDAVRKAYGMKKRDDVLAFLLELNHALAEKEAAGEDITAPGLPPCVKEPADFISEDCVRME